MTYQIINKCSNGGQLVPATLGGDWPLDRLLRYIIDEAWLWRQELWRGCTVTLDIHNDAGELVMQYEVTATYTKGLQWRPMEVTDGKFCPPVQRIA